MNKKLLNKKNLTQEQGITLIALIITIIILVILAAVSVRAVYNMGIVNYAVNGTQNYSKAAVAENEMLDSTGSLIEDTIGKLNGIINNEKNESYLGKYVTYRNTRFIVKEEAGNNLTLLPLTFIHDKLLSGKYIIVDGKPVSVELDSNGNANSEISNNYTVYTDTDASAFRIRIGQELDNACKAAYEKTGITAINTTSTNDTYDITEIYPSVQEALSNNDFASILTMINEFTTKFATDYNISSSSITSVKASDSQGSGEIASAAASYVGSIAGLEEESITNLRNGIIALNSGTDLNSITTNQSEQIMIQIGDSLETYIIESLLIPGYWYNNANEPDWSVSNSMNIMEYMDDNEFLAGEMAIAPYRSATHKIAPVLTVDSSLLQTVNQNEYQIAD